MEYALLDDRSRLKILGGLIMRKVLTLLIVLVFAFTLFAGCANTAQEQAAAEAPSESNTDSGTEEMTADEKPVFAWLLLGANDWTVQYQEAAKEACEENGFDYVDYNCEGDVQKQLDHVQTCISTGVAAIAIQPAENTAIAPALKKAADAGIIVINHFEMDASLGLNDYNNVNFVIFGQYEAGHLIGEAFAEKLPEGSKVGLIGGTAGADNNNQRKQGFTDAVQGKLEVVSEIDANWDRAKAQTAAEDIMTAFDDIAGIYAVDDGMAVGVVEAVKAANKLDQIIVGGTGGDANGLKMLEAGELFATCTVGCDWYATTAVDVVKRLMAGEDVEKMTKYPPELVNQENYSQYK